ncbi:MAG: heavy-metal-associated domain-containing protein [Solirubrobacterales bacterium]|nr:heavy-metal-associated domain-containing protein [Solirubrobacterales bacterium]
MCQTCQCQTDTQPSTSSAVPVSAASRDFTVSGMTCGHCVTSVREEVSEVAGVESVDVDLTSGRLTVTGENVSDDAVKTAVAVAGYEVV